MKILCAIDDSEYSKPAVTFSGKLARAFEAKVTLLVVNVQLGSHSRFGAESMWENADLDRLLTSARDEIAKQGGGDAETTVVSGPEPADAIAEFAKLNTFDHIVLGTGGKSGLARMVLGSVANGVLIRAHCTVTIAR